MINKTKIHVDIGGQLHKRLQKRAHNECRTIACIVRKALELYLTSDNKRKTLRVEELIQILSNPIYQKEVEIEKEKTV